MCATVQPCKAPCHPSFHASRLLRLPRDRAPESDVFLSGSSSGSYALRCPSTLLKTYAIRSTDALPTWKRSFAVFGAKVVRRCGRRRSPPPPAADDRRRRRRLRTRRRLQRRRHCTRKAPTYTLHNSAAADGRRHRAVHVGCTACRSGWIRTRLKETACCRAEIGATDTATKQVAAARWRQRPAWARWASLSSRVPCLGLPVGTYGKHTNESGLCACLLTHDFLPLP